MNKLFVNVFLAMLLYSMKMTCVEFTNNTTIKLTIATGVAAGENSNYAGKKIKPGQTREIPSYVSPENKLIVWQTEKPNTETIQINNSPEIVFEQIKNTIYANDVEIFALNDSQEDEGSISDYSEPDVTKITQTQDFLQKTLLFDSVSTKEDEEYHVEIFTLNDSQEDEESISDYSEPDITQLTQTQDLLQKTLLLDSVSTKEEQKEDEEYDSDYSEPDISKLKTSKSYISSNSTESNALTQSANNTNSLARSIKTFFRSFGYNGLSVILFVYNFLRISKIIENLRSKKKFFQKNPQ